MRLVPFDGFESLRSKFKQFLLPTVMVFILAFVYSLSVDKPTFADAHFPTEPLLWLWITKFAFAFLAAGLFFLLSDLGLHLAGAWTFVFLVSFPFQQFLLHPFVTLSPSFTLPSFPVSAPLPLSLGLLVCIVEAKACRWYWAGGALAIAVLALFFPFLALLLGLALVPKVKDYTVFLLPLYAFFLLLPSLTSAFGVAVLILLLALLSKRITKNRHLTVFFLLVLGTVMLGRAFVYFSHELARSLSWSEVEVLKHAPNDCPRLYVLDHPKAAALLSGLEVRKLAPEELLQPSPLYGCFFLSARSLALASGEVSELLPIYKVQRDAWEFANSRYLAVVPVSNNLPKPEGTVVYDLKTGQSSRLSIADFAIVTLNHRLGDSFFLLLPGKPRPTLLESLLTSEPAVNASGAVIVER